MIILLLTIAVLIVGMVVFKKSRHDGKGEAAGQVLIIVGCNLLVVWLLMFAATHLTDNIQIANDKEQYDKIIAKMQALETIDGEGAISLRELVADDITEWNQKVEEYKSGASNPWVNWFFSQEVADALQYIEVPDAAK